MEEHIVGPCHASGSFLHFRGHKQVEVKLWGERQFMAMYLPSEQLPALRDWLNTAIAEMRGEKA